jgi:hypothetical protein
MSDELLSKIRVLADARDVDLDTLIAEVMNAAVSSADARARFEELAARGRGRDQEALELLRR